MKIIVISSLDPIDQYVIRSLTSSGIEINGVIRVSQRPANSIQLKFNWSTVRSVIRGINMRYVAYRDSRLSKQTSKYLKADSVETIPPELTVQSSEVNGALVKQYLTNINPDFLLLLGSPILKEDIFKIPNHGTINVHYGISPDYRGGNTI